MRIGRSISRRLRPKPVERVKSGGRPAWRPRAPMAAGTQSQLSQSTQISADFDQSHSLLPIRSTGRSELGPTKRSSRARIEGLNQGYGEAAQDLYANRFRSFRRVTLPLLWPGIMAGFTLAFVTSLDDFLTSFFLSGPSVA